jgi:serine/threonine-protein kinase RIO1
MTLISLAPTLSSSAKRWLEANTPRLWNNFDASIPDKKQRRELIERFVLDLFKEKFRVEKTEQEYKAKAGRHGPRRDFFDDISTGKFRKTKTKFKAALRDKDVLKKTALFGYGDLKNLVELKTEVESGMDADSLAQALAETTGRVESAVSLSAYRNRFEEKNPPPFEEFFLLLYLVAECGKEFSTSDRNVIHQVLKGIKVQGEETFEFLRKKEYIEEDAIYDKLYNHRKDILEGWVEVESEDEKAKNPA